MDISDAYVNDTVYDLFYEQVAPNELATNQTDRCCPKNKYYTENKTGQGFGHTKGGESGQSLSMGE